jgi:hypothetical protein
VSPRWGLNEIIALRFYKYFAPLGLLGFTYYLQIHHNAPIKKRINTCKTSIYAFFFCERDSSGTTEARNGEAMSAKVMERIARREARTAPKRLAQRILLRKIQ